MSSPAVPTHVNTPCPRPAWRREGALFLIGLDGLTLDVVAPMVERGELPHLARLAREGGHGPLRTDSPTNSSLLWTSIATGCRWPDHGVDGFEFYRLGRRRVSRGAVRRAKKLLLGPLVGWLERSGRLVRHMFDGRHVRAKRIWEIVSECGGRVGVLNWWHTWPADAVNGFVISDRIHFWRSAARKKGGELSEALTYPPELLDDLRNLVIPPDEVAADQLRPFLNVPESELQEFLRQPFRHFDLRGELRFIVSADETYRRMFERALDTYPALDVVAALFRMPDVAQHCAFQFMPQARAQGVSDDDVGRYGNVVPQAYRWADGLLGMILERMGPQDSLVVVSDHGFTYQEKRGEYGHARGEPPGVIYLCGKEFRQGVQLRDASIYDIVPTALALCGLPATTQMPGRCLREALTQEFRAAHAELERLPTYGPRPERQYEPQASRQVDREVADHLKALGYLE